MNQWVNYLLLNETDADKKLENIKQPTQQKIQEILSNNLDLFQATWIGNLFKIIGWLITWMFYWIAQMMLNTLKNIFTLGGLLDNKDVTHLSHILTPLALSIMLITIAMLGLMMMTGKRIQISNVLVNLILAICFISITPYLFHTLSTMTLQFQQDQEKIPAQLSYSKEDKKHNQNMDLPSRVVQTNTVDLAEYANKDFPSRKKVKPKDLNHLYVPNNSKSIFDSFDYSEKMKPFYQGEDDDKIGYHDTLKMESRKEMSKTGHTTTPNDLLTKSIGDHIIDAIKGTKGDSKTAKQERDIIRNGVFAYQINYDQDTLVESKNKEKPVYSRMAPSEDSGAFKSAAGVLKFFDEYPLRYQANFLVLWLSLGGLAIVYLLSAFKVVKLLFDIAFQKLLTPFVALTDLTTGQKMKSLFSNIILNYSVIPIIYVLFILYQILVTAVMNSNAGMGVKAIGFIALSLACIDGPDTAKRVLGIDTGVQDGKGAALGAYGAAKGAGKLAGAAAGTTFKGGNSLYNKMTGGTKDGGSNNSINPLSESKSPNGNSSLEPTDLSKYDVAGSHNKSDQFDGNQSTQDNEQNINDTSEENENANKNIAGDQSNSNDDTKLQDIENENDKPGDTEISNENTENDLSNQDHPGMSNDIDHSEKTGINGDQNEMNGLENDEKPGVNEEGQDIKDLENNNQQPGMSNDIDHSEKMGINGDQNEMNGLENDEKPGVNEEGQNINSLENNEQTGINDENQDVKNLENNNQPGMDNDSKSHDGLENSNTGNQLENNQFDAESNETVKGMNELSNDQQQGISKDVNNEYMQENAQSTSYPNSNSISDAASKSYQSVPAPMNNVSQGTSASKAGSISGFVPNQGQTVSAPTNRGNNGINNTKDMKSIKESPNIGQKASTNSGISKQTTPNRHSNMPKNRAPLSYYQAKSNLRNNGARHTPMSNNATRQTPRMKQTTPMNKVPSNMEQKSSMNGTSKVPRQQHNVPRTSNRNVGLSYSEAKSNLRNALNTHSVPQQTLQRSPQFKQPSTNATSSRASRPSYMAQKAPSMDNALNKSENVGENNDN
ncbi:hypothetical protein [Staphylococcus capitis]|uniref:hypothetical protein n=1 Tax=Staphylococcus capitis TaxID=29388 RepID=UPI003D067986